MSDKPSLTPQRIMVCVRAGDLGTCKQTARIDTTVDLTQATPGEILAFVPKDTANPQDLTLTDILREAWAQYNLPTTACDPQLTWAIVIVSAVFADGLTQYSVTKETPNVPQAYRTPPPYTST